MKMHDPKMLHAIIQALAKVPSKHFTGEDEPKMPSAHVDVVAVGKPGHEDEMSEEGSPMPDMESDELKHDHSMKKLHAMKGR